MKPPFDDIPDPDSPPPLPPPRFTLRTLLLAMLAVGILLAYAQAAGPLSTMMLILLILAIVAHVAGNAIGTQLRDHQSRPAAPPVHVPIAPRPAMSTTNLSQREHLGWPMWVSVISGVIFGGVGGAWLFLSTEVEKATWQDTLLGALAFAVLGGMVGFVIGSFCQVAYRAHRQARTDEFSESSGSDTRTGNSNRNVAPSDSPSL